MIKTINLAQETIDFLAHLGKSASDVVWVGNKNGSSAISWDEFIEMAKRIDYDNGFGSQEIADDLVVVGNNWWLERHEYDGSESWEYQSRPELSKAYKPFVFKKQHGGWHFICELNKEP